MKMPYKVACIIASTFAAAVSSSARGEIIVTSRFSEVWYHSVNLTDGVPPPTAQVTLTDPWAPFAQTLSADFDHITVTGAHNTGHCTVFQNTSITATDVFCDASQFLVTTTDFDSPGLYGRSLLTLDFTVASSVPVTLTGLIIGSSNPAHTNFARVELAENGGVMFSTTFHTFPFAGVLSPGNAYRLEVEASGLVNFNDAVDSRAVVAMAVPTPAASMVAGAGLLTLARRRTLRSGGG